MDRNWVLGAAAIAFGGCATANDGGGEEVASSQASVTAGDAAAPLALGPEGVWTWYDAVPGVKCADGSPSGFAVNPLRSGNGKVLFFMDGGGMCVDQSSCNSLLKTTAHTSYGASDFAAEMTSASSEAETTNVAAFGSYTWSKPLGSRGLWDRTSASNPFKDYDYVFVPYCTGDLFMGSRHDTSSAFPSVRTPSGSWFVGDTNVGVFAQQVLALFPSAPAIALVGSSAGGLGTLYAYPQLKALYPHVPVTVISDAGAPFWTGDEGFTPRQGFLMLNFEPPGVPSYEEDWFADAWGLDATHPAGVAAVTRTGARRSMYPLQTSLVVEATGGPDAFGLVEATNDPLVPWYFHLSVNGLAPPNVAGAESDLSAHVTAPNVHTLWIASSQAPNPNLRPWNQHHTFLFDDVGMWTQTGLSSWLANLPL